MEKLIAKLTDTVDSYRDSWTKETTHDNTMYWMYVEDNQHISVLERMTGFGHRDVETGYRDAENKFWLASGHYDIRWYSDITIETAIHLIKENANTCVGVQRD